MKRKILLWIMLFAVLFTCLPVNNVSAKSINDSDVFLKQQTNYTCTLASAAMMLRRRAILDNENWTAITENSLRSVAWREGSGLYFNFTYNGIKVGHDYFSNIKQQLISMLNQHPEGIVIYNTSQPHAVLVTDYDSSSDTFYCGDPMKTPGRIKLSDSILSGSGQSGKLAGCSAYWYITNRSGGGQPPTNVSLSTDSTIYAEKDSVQFNISASGNVKYSIEIYRNDIKVYTGNPTGNFSYTPKGIGNYTARLAASNNAGTTYSSWVSFDVVVGDRSVSGDFNGDGLDDYATLYDYGVGKAQWHVFLSDGDSFSEEIWWSESHEGWYNTPNCAGRIVSGDFNGDGLDDIASIYLYEKYKSSIHVFLSTGNSFQAWQTWLSLTEYESAKIIDRVTAGDFNGDGKDDIAAMYGYNKWDTSIHVFLSTGESFQLCQTWFKDSVSYGSSRVTGRIDSGDFNGDGLDDIAAMYEYDIYNTAIHVFLSTGSSFDNWQSWYSELKSWQASRDEGRLAVGDFSGDGLDDVAAMYNYDDHVTIHVWVSEATVFCLPDWWITETQFDPQNITGRFEEGDFNGDGIDDIVTLYDYNSNHSIFHMYMSDTKKFHHEWWNDIKGYDARRTTGIKPYTDQYVQPFIFSKKDIKRPMLFTKINFDDIATVHNNSNSPQNATVILTKYMDGLMNDFVIYNETFAPDETKTYSHGANAKVFVWESLTGMKPLAW